MSAYCLCPPLKFAISNMLGSGEPVVTQLGLSVRLGTFQKTAQIWGLSFCCAPAWGLSWILVARFVIATKL